MSISGQAIGPEMPSPRRTFSGEPAIAEVSIVIVLYVQQDPDLSAQRWLRWPSGPRPPHNGYNSGQLILTGTDPFT